MNKKCEECKLCSVNDDMTSVVMSSADWQRSEQRHLRREKRFVGIIVLLIILLVGSNIGWLWYENQFEVVEETTTETITTTYENIEQTTDAGGNNLIGGDYVNGEAENR